MAPHEEQRNEQEAAATENVAADMAQAFKELAKEMMAQLIDTVRGESTATAMENQLTSLESKIDDLLAMVDENSELAKHVALKTSKDSANGEKSNAQ